MNRKHAVYCRLLVHAMQNVIRGAIQIGPLYNTPITFAA